MTTGEPSSLLRAAVDAACALDLDRVPADVQEHAARVIADTMVVSWAGSREPEATGLLEEDLRDGRVRPRAEAASSEGMSATVLGSGLPVTTAENAAFVNATFGSFLELDEGMRPTGHPAMHVVSAAVAAAEHRDRSGRALLRAVICGYEVTSRLFRAYRLQYPVHPHGHLAALGGAVAVALLEDGDPLQYALLAGTTPTATVWQTCYEGASVRATYMGLGARRAVESGRLARAGFVGSQQAFDTIFGSIMAELVDPEAMTAPLDHDDLGITRNYFKLHSACALTHAAVDAVLGLEVSDPYAYTDVLVETVSNNMKLDRHAAPNALSGRFSLPYTVATALLRGECTPTTMRYDEEVAEYSRRVRITVADDLEAYWPSASPARVTLTGPEGSVSTTVENPHGFYTDPLSPEELRQKFLTLAGEPGFSAVWDRVMALSDLTSCRELFAGVAS